MSVPLVERLKTLTFKVRKALWMDYWFPHLPLAVLSMAAGVLLLRTYFGLFWYDRIYALAVTPSSFSPSDLPSLLVGAGLIMISVGLLFRSRMAWTMSMLLLMAATASLIVALHGGLSPLVVYFLILLAALLLTWRSFNRASLAAGTMFALTSVVMLLLYATFGAFYLGADFRPSIKDLVTAMYFSVVTMSTVGYGDIVPQTIEAKLFTVSIIVLGVAVFATSLTAVIAPLVSRSLDRIVNRRSRKVIRENHFIVIGSSSLALNTCRELERRGRSVTRIVLQSQDENDEMDIVVGDPSNVEVLKQAGAERAAAVLAMFQNDSDNAFVVLAVKELHTSAKTVAAVNDASSMRRIKLVQPDIVIAPQVLGGELLAMMLSGEKVTPEFILDRLFKDGVAGAKPDES